LWDAKGARQSKRNIEVTLFTRNVSLIGDRCAVFGCNNDRSFPETCAVKDLAGFLGGFFAGNHPNVFDLARIRTTPSRVKTRGLNRRHFNR